MTTTTIKPPETLAHREKVTFRRIVAQFGADNLEPSDTMLVRDLAVMDCRLEDIRELIEQQRTSGRKGGEGERDLPYLLERNSRQGISANPLIGHERETVVEVRRLHERLTKVIADRQGLGGPQSLAQMQQRLAASSTTPRRPRVVSSA
jgi:hypothetical protein